MSADTVERKAPTKVEEYTAKALEWDRERAEALADLEAVESGAGADLLDDPGAAESLAGRVGALRARADLAGRAAAEARARAHSARVDVKRGEVAALEPAVAKARKALDEHDAKRDQLRKALEDFTGLTWAADPPSFDASGRRTLVPREKLTSALERVVTEQRRLQDQAEAIAADPDWKSPEERHQEHVREWWDKAVAGHRQAAHDLECIRKEIPETAAAVQYDLEAATHVPQWLANFRADAARLVEELRGFDSDVEHFRKQGLDLSDDEVSALKVELGLEVE